MNVHIDIPETIPLTSELVYKIGKLLHNITAGKMVDFDDIIDLAEELAEQLPAPAEELN